jgi:periplasmic divalent cation tolerance protein
MSDFCLIFVTASSDTEAQAIASHLVTNQLAACVSLMPIQSIYTWQGQLQHEPEVQLIIKTESARFDQVAAQIQQIHSYEVPEIIAIPIIQGSQPYLNWLHQSLKG